MKLFWNEQYNYLALVQDVVGSVPIFYIVDEEYKDSNPAFMYPVKYLDHYGWVEIGKIP